ncbi:ABC transporter ATP-binding protein [Litchfieldia salsa]|uniref:ABC-2 type transport system ATP-binding protein n=1 Tax=Litchfieldia salsa TaxID=930152 RepID=A0A1H0Q9K1_9BACI|nr:ATP-binding cassette domain-containing protein [Litchfieldia salsa]SDP14017.1 ABC-2 type transport system ATP-binding protein [Litchfieldia salsa]
MLIQVRDLKKTYVSYERGSSFIDTIASLFKRKTIEVTAVKGLDLDIAKGEIIGFLGPNGAGKSTTIKILTGILHPSSGEVQIMGYTPWKERKKYVMNIGAVFGQKSQLLWDTPPLDAFHMNKAIYDLEEKQFRETLDELVELLDVAEVVRKPTRQLSLGERMKCEFIMAMLHRPSVVFLDEPTIGLDMISKEKVHSFIQEMNRKGVTFLLTTHDLGDIEELASRIVVISHGEKVFDDSMTVLRNFLGAKKIVYIRTDFPSHWKGINGVKVLKQVSANETELELETDQLPLKDFIRMVNERFTVIDMSIDTLPIEQIIKEIYKKK